ncbi:MAG: hypothetical protein HC853_11180 [Anaerolineae bacterium]|nr:hypothetical protein [Anaerolineae bacterium]
MNPNYLGLPFHTLHGEIDYLFDQLKNYIGDAEKALQAFKLEEDKRLKAQISNDSLLELFIDQYQDFSERLIPRNFRYSSLVFVYSSLEAYMNALCNYLYNSWALPICLADLNGRSSISKWRKFFDKIVKVPNLDYREVEDFAKVRNCIVHNMGRPSHDQTHLLQLCNRGLGLSLNKSESKLHIPELIVSVEYCHFVIDVSRKLLLKIADGLEAIERSWMEANIYEESGNDLDYDEV